MYLGKDRISVYPELSLLIYVSCLFPDTKELETILCNYLSAFDCSASVKNVAIPLQDLQVHYSATN